MATILDTMTGGLAATEMGKGEGAREGILGDRETAQQLKLALTQSRSKWPLAFVNHLTVYIL